jgi:biopolymer transport protein TolR
MSMDVGAAKTKSDPNITPLIDVLLVLLIIFMVITPILQKGFDSQVPQKATNADRNPNSNVIVLQIDPSGNLSINKENVTFNDLGDRLNAIYSTRPDKILFVDADDHAKYDDVIKAIDVAKGQGKVETIGFVLN